MKKQTAKEEPQPTKFDFFKAEILKRAKDANACAEQYKRAYASVSFAELFTVIKDNFNYACNNKIVDFELLTTVKDEARESEIFVNESTKIGYLFAWGNATVKAGGNATVKAGGNATVEAWDNATVEAGGNATVEAWGNATVKAGGNATVEAWVNATVEAWGNATVKAWGNAFISSYKTVECKLAAHAISRNTTTNEITIVDGAYTIKTVKI